MNMYHNTNIHYEVAKQVHASWRQLMMAAYFVEVSAFSINITYDIHDHHRQQQACKKGMLTMAASSALFLPVETPTPSMAVPLLHMMDFTSAKSTFTRPGMVMMSEMPCTPYTGCNIG